MLYCKKDDDKYRLLLLIGFEQVLLVKKRFKLCLYVEDVCAGREHLFVNPPLRPTLVFSANMKVHAIRLSRYIQSLEME